MVDNTKKTISPYIGVRPFQFYESKFYTGRENDLSKCLNNLVSPGVCVFVIHGLSGSGKSSFLQAAMLPRINDLTGSGYHLLRNDSVTITGGDQVIAKIAKVVYVAALKFFEEFPLQDDLNWLKETYEDVEIFARESENDINHICVLLIKMSADPKVTWVMAVDHVERIISLEGDQEKIKDGFLKLVSNFDQDYFNAKLILSLRTEKYGKFASEIPQFQQPSKIGEFSVNRLSHYFLPPPNKDSLKEIVEYPAQFESSGVNYRSFKFSEALPEKIVNWILSLKEVKNKETEPLPILQAVCSILYYECLKSSQTESEILITEEDFNDYINMLKADSVKCVMESYVYAAFDNSGINKRLDKVRWRKVLSCMATPKLSNEMGGYGIELEGLKEKATEYQCGDSFDDVISKLSVDPLPLINNDSHHYTFQHDLLVLPFLGDEESSISLDLKHHKREKDRIERISKLKVDDLLDNAYLDKKIKVSVVNLDYWDHKLVAFAKDKGFFDRLGFDVEVFTNFENIQAEKIVRRCRDKEPDRCCIFTYPRNQVEAVETRKYTDVAIINYFTGYAIVGSRSYSKEKISEGKFVPGIYKRILDDLSGDGNRYILAEDKFAKKFFLDLIIEREQLDIESEFIDVIKKKVKVIEESQELQKAHKIIEKLDEKECLAAVITPTVRAFAHELQFPTLLEQKNWYVDEDTNHKHYTGGNRSINTGIHNFLYIDKLDFDNEEEESRILYLLMSIVFFSSEYVFYNDKEFAKWVYDQLYEEKREDKESERPLFDSVLEIFRNSYVNFPPSYYYDKYFDPSSEYCYRESFKDGNSNKYNSFSVIVNFRKLKSEYLMLSMRVGAVLPNNPAFNVMYEKAMKNAQVYNYYGALKILLELENKIKELQ